MSREFVPAGVPRTMTLSNLPLSYCTNVHPGQTVAEVVRGLTEYTGPLRGQFGQPLAAGLWLASPVVEELLAAPKQIELLRETLGTLDLTCHTLNAFPYGDFHSERVKENVYIPDWSDLRRLNYTQECAAVLSRLLPEGGEGSISTVPLGFKQFAHPADFLKQCADQLIDLAAWLAELEEKTGRTIRLAIEPEPLCVLETTAETLEFFDYLWQRAADKRQIAAARRHLGVCYDVCHQSVEFEDVADSIRRLREADIRLNKIHITCAIEVRNPGDNREAREALCRYVEPRYLHQTTARTAAGEVLRFLDLDRDFALEPPTEFAAADTWRVHFHVPVNAETLGPLHTTRLDLQRALATVAALDYAPHLEVETYTWEVLPGREKLALVDGLTRELTATRELLDTLRGQPPAVK